MNANENSDQCESLTCDVERIYTDTSSFKLLRGRSLFRGEEGYYFWTEFSYSLSDLIQGTLFRFFALHRSKHFNMNKLNSVFCLKVVNIVQIGRLNFFRLDKFKVLETD